jgi:23S rRNA (adenine2503-C2)-methyltransferase
MTQKPLIYDYTYGELEKLFSNWEEPSYRAIQVWHGLYRQLYSTPGEFSNLPVSLRARLESHFLFSHLSRDRVVTSQDGYTIKTLFRLPDRQGMETVYMYYSPTRDKKSPRHTLCISTQVGCAMGCVFCATGQMGFKRHLSSGEIVEQVIIYARQLQDSNSQITNIVVMGMGEPFHNYEETIAAIYRLNDPQGFNLGARRFTISTVGLVPLIRRFAKEQHQINLAISLHSADDTQRSSMLPINKKYPLESLIDACRYYVAQTHRRITFEWALIKDVNDSMEDAQRLTKLLAGLLCHVNVIPLNPTKGYVGNPSPSKQVIAFQSELLRQNIPCTIRTRRGIEISAGCGQLVVERTTSPPG